MDTPTPSATPSDTPTTITSPASTWLGGETPLEVPRDTSALSSIGLGISKKDRSAIKRKDKKTYFKVRDNAIEGLESKFTQLQSIDEKSTLDHLKKVYSVVNRFADLQHQVEQNDMGDVFTIPSEFTLDPTSGHYVPSPHAKAINLFTDSNVVSLITVRRATAYFTRFGTTYHGENILWSGEKILNSCDTSLRDKLVESTRDWPRADVGGPVYLKLLLSLVLSTSEKSLRTLMDKLGKLRITDFPGENVTQAVSFLRGAILILRDNSSTPADLLTLVLRIFKASTCEPFCTYVSSIDTLVELDMKQYNLDSLLTMLDGKYIDLLGRGEWTSTSPSEGQSSAFSANVEDLLRIICFNCGAVGHGVNNCPVARDDTMINLRREIMESYSSRRENPRTSNNNGNRRSNSGSGGGGDPLLRPPGKNEPHEKHFDGVKKFWCGKAGCRRWTDHISSEHPGGPASAHLANNGSSDPEADAPSVTGTEASQSISTSSTITEATGSLATTLQHIPHHFG
jgi:hypothetical protein